MKPSKLEDLPYWNWRCKCCLGFRAMLPGDEFCYGCERNGSLGVTGKLIHDVAILSRYLDPKYRTRTLTPKFFREFSSGRPLIYDSE